MSKAELLEQSSAFALYEHLVVEDSASDMGFLTDDAMNMCFMVMWRITYITL